MRPVRRVLEGTRLAVMHAASQDLEVLDLACGALPARLFDTQIAAGFLGHWHPVARRPGRAGDRRPPAQGRPPDRLAAPAARRPTSSATPPSDVAYLLGLHDRLTEQLRGRGRLDWAWTSARCSASRGRGVRDPEDAWRRIKEARQLRGAAAGVGPGGRRLARAAGRRRSTSRCASCWPTSPSSASPSGPRRTLDDLRRVRGRRRPAAPGARSAEELLDAVAEGRERTRRRPKGPARPELDRQLRPAVDPGVGLGQPAGPRPRDRHRAARHPRRHRGAPRRRGDGPPRRGLAADLVGEPIRGLVDGEAALAFDGHGGLVLEPRSNEPI